MTVQQAVARWQRRQARLLARIYRASWDLGVANFHAQYATPPATATGPVPAQPPTQTMSRGLAPALTSLARMSAQIATLTPAVGAATAKAGQLLAVQAYLNRNGWLLAGGVSAAWAGEQAGYAFAAAAHGLLLEWQLDPRAEHCVDCPALATLPPLPLDLWPTLPGEGQTECSVGCRCSMKAVGGHAPALTGAQLEVLSRVANRRPVLV